MRVALATLCLNEMAWLPKLYEQHKDWQGLCRYVFVEAADRVFADTNPGMVSPEGLSVDGTSEFLRGLAARDGRVAYVPYGITSHPDDPAQGKCAARTAYLRACESVEPDVIVTSDADEYWPRECQAAVIDTVRRNRQYNGFVFRHREIWRPPSLAGQPPFAREVVGGFWDIPYCRVWRWFPGLEYRRNHNTPERDGTPLDRRLFRAERKRDAPYYVHMAWASDLRSRQAKNAYYAARGEGRTDHRGPYVAARRSWETWRPGDVLPGGAQVIPYTGAIPECFSER